MSCTQASRTYLDASQTADYCAGSTLSGCPCRRQGYFRYTKRCCPEGQVDVPRTNVDVFLPQTCGGTRAAILEALGTVTASTFDTAGTMLPTSLNCIDALLVNNAEAPTNLTLTEGGSVVWLELVCMNGGVYVRKREGSPANAVDLANTAAVLSVTRQLSSGPDTCVSVADEVFFP